MAKQLKDNVWIRLPKQVTFQSVMITLMILDADERPSSIKAKFHCAILVADRSEVGCRPVANLPARC